MKLGDLVRIRKSHPAVRRWRKSYLRAGTPYIGKWAEEDTPLLHIGECDYGVGRVKVLGPGGQLASFDDYLLTVRGMQK
jgi:hypothetical protein|tara:strand:- start:271 stop:507 length:237 start_codon:yes stop_codon:yes gene_type:complete